MMVSIPVFAKETNLGPSTFDIPFEVTRLKCFPPNCDPNLFQPTKHTAHIKMKDGLGMHTEWVYADQVPFRVDIVMLKSSPYTLQVNVWDPLEKSKSSMAIYWIQDPTKINRVSLNSPEYWQGTTRYSVQVFLPGN